MSRKRGRPPREYRLRVRTVRRDPIDYEALARAALEQAAMNQSVAPESSAIKQHQNQPPASNGSSDSEEPDHDRLA